MSKSPEYEQLKQLANKIYADLMGLSPKATEDHIIVKYKQLITTYVNVFREFSVKFIDDLDELAEEGKRFDKKLDKVYKDKYRNELKEQPFPALDTFKKIRDCFVDFRRDKPHLPPIPQWPNNIPFRIAYQDLQDWCTSAKKGIKEIDTGVDLTDTEQNIIEALGKNKLTGEELAKKAGYPCNSHFKNTLSSLRKRGILDNKAPGYILEPEYQFLLNKSN